MISQRKQIIELNDKNNYYNEIIKLQKIILSRNSGKIFTLKKEIKLLNKNMDELIGLNDLSNNDF
jgi:DNA integrity scanning protein DisA with diadenylate cyclase activity